MTLRKPNLFLVGAPRCGTTALHKHLGAHPSVFMSPVKELHYFSHDLFLPPPQATIADEQEYLTMFGSAGDQPWLGEASPFYLYSETAAAAIKAFNPEARVVITLRNPADMMYSMYCLRVRAALFHPAQETAPSFELALAHGPARLRGELLPPGAPTGPRQCLYLCYREQGRYVDRVERYLDVFGRDAVHIIIFDDLRSDIAGTYRRLCEFLDIDASFVPSFDIGLAERAAGARHRSDSLARALWRPPRSAIAAARTLLPPGWRRGLRNAFEEWNTRPPPPLEAETRRLLLEDCASDIVRLGELIGRDLTPWLRTTEARS